MSSGLDSDSTRIFFNIYIYIYIYIIYIYIYACVCVRYMQYIACVEKVQAQDFFLL